MKILLTGGAGFIASHIADRYLAEGHEVTIVDDLSTGRRENLPPGVRFHQVSIASREAASLVMREKPDCLNHHAAQIDVRRSVADPKVDAEVNILGTLNLLEAARRGGVGKIVFASTGGAIYGEQDMFPANEQHRTDPLSPYGIAKLTIEKYLQFYAATYGIPFVALRYGNVYGPRQNALGEAGVIAIFAGKLLQRTAPTIYGDGKQTRDYIYIDDVVACNMRALDPGVRGIFNVGTGKETDVNTIARELIRLTGVDVAPVYAETRAGEQKRSCLKPGTLQTTPPLSLEEGLRRTIHWFKNGPR